MLHAGRGVEPAHPPRAAADAAAGRDLAADGRARSSSSRRLGDDPRRRDERADLRRELRDLMLLTLESPEQPAQPLPS